MVARLRQAVLAATDLEPVTARLRDALGLGEPYSDPAVAAFGLRNAVFALGDTFLEVVSPVRAGTAAGRWLERRGGDCGYMAMFEVDELSASRHAISRHGIREVFALELDDMAEVHLHPADVGGAIVAVSQPRPPGSWRWGGPDWAQRSSPQRVTGVTVSIPNVEHGRTAWSAVLGHADLTELGVRFTDDYGEAGIVEISLAGPAPAAVDLGGVRVVCSGGA